MGRKNTKITIGKQSFLFLADLPLKNEINVTFAFKLKGEKLWKPFVNAKQSCTFALGFG